MPATPLPLDEMATTVRHLARALPLTRADKLPMGEPKRVRLAAKVLLDRNAPQ
jgi:hypothetical protein